jgi:hypothetical protein
MRWRRRRDPARRRSPAAAQSETIVADSELGDDELCLCCICGALILGLDLEDELDGEGPGRHICGACNRTRNFDMEMGC